MIDENIVADNIEETATPQIENTETEVTTIEPTEPVKPDITQTQAFAQRLKEEKAKGIDEEYERLYGESHNIHSKADYDRVVAEQEEEERRQNLQTNGYDPEVLDEYVKNNPAIKKAEEYIYHQELEKFKNNDNMEFLNYFEKENKRPFDVEKDILPEEIWEVSNKFQNSFGNEGKSLLDLYQKHENSILKAKIAEYEKGNLTQTINSENAIGTTGSVTGNGASVPTELTVEMIENMQPSELAKRWKEVKKVMNMK